MECEHKYGRVRKDGYQYCVKCGIAREPLKNPPYPCVHQWEHDANITSNRDDNITVGVRLRCIKCGLLTVIKH